MILNIECTTIKRPGLELVKGLSFAGSTPRYFTHAHSAQVPTHEQHLSGDREN
jgi:hypothetical protein